MGLALVPWHLFLGDEVVRALKDSLANHFHGMDFLELGDLEDHHVVESRLVEDLHHKMSSPKIADLYGDLSGTVLKKPMRKTGVKQSCCGALPFVC